MTSILARASGGSAAVIDKRQGYLDSAQRLFAQARVAAEKGDVPESGSLILRALDQERRAGGVGPQVMQLIKPRQ